jgi:hypothetical protein
MKPKEMLDSNLANYLSGRRRPAKCTTFESPLTYRGVKPQDAWMPFHWAQVNVHDNQIRVKFFDLFDCYMAVGVTPTPAGRESWMCQKGVGREWPWPTLTVPLCRWIRVSSRERNSTCNQTAGCIALNLPGLPARRSGPGGCRFQSSRSAASGGYRPPRPPSHPR